MSFGKILLEFRAKYNLSQNELADIIEVTPIMVFRYENEKSNPRRMNKIRIENKMKEWEQKNG